MSTEKITIDATVDAPVETVWARYTDPDHITRWNFASDDWCCPSASTRSSRTPSCAANSALPGGKSRPGQVLA